MHSASKGEFAMLLLNIFMVKDNLIALAALKSKSSQYLSLMLDFKSLLLLGFAESLLAIVIGLPFKALCNPD
ncbi:hypothetical protein PanWU01x14_293650 [Parasponia andersonii]|uniref:Uncharacterized protein n=1 Tax=Parasponia andersonii TaxID=3476 RepID=A0A2P5AWI0_PARAD|nr:hypothetical protein PanWU01x14_293650 [Parasponia andersonii]